jgi:hypothetical protein
MGRARSSGRGTPLDALPRTARRGNTHLATMKLTSARKCNKGNARKRGRVGSVLE